MTNQPQPPTGSSAPQPPVNSGAVDNRAYLEAVYNLFNTFALEDQRQFYIAATAKHRKASAQVNRLRATFSLLTGLASALAGLLVQASFGYNGSCGTTLTQQAAMQAENVFAVQPAGCTALQVLIVICTIFTIIMPALGAAANILADLYQWDRLITIYDAALENLEVADAQSPDPEMETENYAIALRVYGEGTLGVMADETAQWGQLIRTPPAIEEFLKNEDEIANRASQPISGKGESTGGNQQAIG